MKPRAGRPARSRSVGPSALFILLQKKNYKMDIFTSFATDETLENNGKWRPLSKTAKILVARSGNDKYVELLRAKMQEAQLDLSSGSEADEIAQGILIDVMAESILLGWEGLTYQGKEAPYSREMAKTFLKVKDFRKKVSAMAEDFEAFRVQEDKAQGND
jgi:hypothetical protein